MTEVTGYLTSLHRCTPTGVWRDPPTFAKPFLGDSVCLTDPEGHEDYSSDGIVTILHVRGPQDRS